MSVTFGGTSSSPARFTHTEYIYRPQRRGIQNGGGNPFGGIVPGLLLTAGASALLWWNEGRSARTEHMLAHARRALTPLDGSSSAALDGADDGGLVHLTGQLSTGGVRDGLFGEVRRPDALRLRRTTEVYQWQETEHTSERRVSSTHVERKTRYDYHQQWSTRQIDSRRFRDSYNHQNINPRLPAGVDEVMASDVTLPSGVHVPRDLLEQLDEWQNTPLPAGLRRRDGAAVAPLAGKGRSGGVESIYMAAPGTPSADERADGSHLRYEGSGGGGSSRQPMPRRITSELGNAVERVTHTDLDGDGDVGVVGRQSGGEVARRYLEEEGQRLDRLDGKSMASVDFPPIPIVGDARVSFTEVGVPEDGVSILASLQPSKRGFGSKPVLKPWWAPDQSESRGIHSSPSLFMLVSGKVSPKEMLAMARSKSNRIKWLLRAGGAGLMWIGLAMTLSFLPALASYVPFVGGIASGLAGVATSLASLGGALAGSSLVIAAAWARFRPFHAAALAITGAAAAFGQGWFLRQRALAKSLGTPKRPGGLARRAMA